MILVLVYLAEILNPSEKLIFKLQYFKTKDTQTAAVLKEKTKDSQELLAWIELTGQAQDHGINSRLANRRINSGLTCHKLTQGNSYGPLVWALTFFKGL